MLSFTSFEEVTPTNMGASAGEDIGALIGTWFLMGLAYHLLVITTMGGKFWKVLQSSLSWRIPTRSLKDYCCPKRRARWYKCAKRSRKSCSSDEDCPLSRCAMNLVKMHLPPPLPMKQKTKSPAKSPREEVSASEQVDQTRGQNNAEGVQRIQVQNVQYRAPLIDLARMQYWKSVVNNANRKEAKHRDDDGLYPLHWACSGGPPLEVVETLLKVYPSAARKVDREGSTALHFATHYCASAPVIAALIKANPKAVKVQDRYGRTPLYHAVEKCAGVEILKELARSDPSAILRPCLPSKLRSTTISRVTAQRAPLYLAWSAVLLDRKARTSMRGKKWDKAQALLEAAYLHEEKMSGRTSSKYEFLRATIALDLYLPEKVVDLALNIESAKLRDEVDGRLPLMKAAASALVSRRRSKELIEMLLTAYPDAANQTDFYGKSALHIALESGKPWEAGVETLFKACPDAVGWVETRSGLVPFMSAATVCIASASNEETRGEALEDDNNPFSLLTPKELDILKRRRKELLDPLPSEDGISEDEQHSTIFNVLRADPSVLQSVRF